MYVGPLLEQHLGRRKSILLRRIVQRRIAISVSGVDIGSPIQQHPSCFIGILRRRIVQTVHSCFFEYCLLSTLLFQRRLFPTLLFQRRLLPTLLFQRRLLPTLLFQRRLLPTLLFQRRLLLPALFVYYTTHQ